jgi:hypothetical protein
VNEISSRSNAEAPLGFTMNSAIASVDHLSNTVFFAFPASISAGPLFTTETLAVVLSALP